MAIGKNIKGITIEFNGDTTKLGKAITDADKKTKSLDNQLKQVNKALKFNPGNTELLAQKQQLLGKKVEETKNKLTALKEAQAKLDDDPAVDKTSQDYMELRREIIETESKLKHFEQQMKELNNIKFEQLGKKVQDVGNKVKSVGDNMTKYVTGPIVAAGAGSIKAFQEVDAGLDIVTQKTGASGEALQGMHDTVKTLAQEVPSDFETIGTAVGEVSTRFGVTGSDLEDLSEKFLKFAKINGVDVNSAVDTTQKALAAFGLEAKDAGPLLDTLNKVGQDTGASMDALMNGLVQNGTAFQELGLNAQQSAILMGQLETSGANSETVMQGLRKALKNAAKEGVPFDQALSDLQDTILNGKDGMDGLTASYDLFGKSGDQIYGAIKNGTIDFEELGKAATDASGSVEDTFNETLDPADKFAMAMSGIKVTGYEVGATILETVAPAIEKLGEFIQNLAEKWKSLSPETQGFILKMAGLVAVIGPALSIIGRMTIGIGGLITILPKLIGGFTGVIKAFGLLSKALLTNPWALVAAAAIAAIILIVKNWDKIKEFFSKLWEGIKNVASIAWEGIKKAIITPIKNAVDSAKKFFGNLKQNIVSTINALRKNVADKFNAIKEAMLAPIRKARDLIKKIIEKIKGFFNFDFKLPKIKLPHFSINPPGWKLSDLLEGSIPSLGIDWYAKGGIFRSPSVIGVGEKGPEAVLPIEKLQEMMAGMADSIVNGLTTTMLLQTPDGPGEITIPIYLYPSGPKMGEETVKIYDQYKRILG